MRRVTIVAAAVKAPFAVMVAEQLWHDPPSGRTGKRTKIAAHPSLPLALATAGFARIGDHFSIDVLTEELNYFTRTSDLTPSGVRAHLAMRLGARVRAQCEADPGKTDEHRKMRKLDVYIAAFEHGRAELGRLRLTTRSESDEPPPYLTAPTHIGILLQDEVLATDDWLNGAPTWTGLMVRKRLVGTVRRGIEIDAASQRRVREADGPIDSVIVRARGVTLTTHPA